jgi:hypothetical protein
LQVTSTGAFEVAESVQLESEVVVRLVGPDGGLDVTVATETISVEYVSCGKPAPKDELRVRPLTIAPVAS